MKTPKEFDYDLWKTEEGRYMVRVKETGEVCEADSATMRLLRAEEKRLRRSMQGSDETGTVLSLDYVSTENDEGMTPAWLEDPNNMEDGVSRKQLLSELVGSLTEKQREVFANCIQNGMSLRAFARSRGLAIKTVEERVEQIQKKYKKFFE